MSMRDPKAGGPRSDKAVALRYWAGLPAPFVAAKASGPATARLLAIAKEAGVPIVEDGVLAQALFPLDFGDWVPEEYYGIVARVFAFVKSIEET
ncbi:MAG TPA: EscU/YscU/HrcU family type III secretion system export apparatus switch protein [Rectinemataceae bacterium]|nr:EscU/YscU/HrcU family type III secretion system export apparatus switch protein [Rectinemataceae bacterium]